jgi:hypothetical protein
VKPIPKGEIKLTVDQPSPPAGNRHQRRATRVAAKRRPAPAPSVSYPLPTRFCLDWPDADDAKLAPEIRADLRRLGVLRERRSR